MTPNLDNSYEQAAITQLELRAATPEDYAQLRVFLARTTEQAYTLDQHQARPRYQPSFTRCADVRGQIVGCALVAHQRLRLGAAVIEAGLVELFVQEPWHEAGVFAMLLGDTLRVLLENGLPLAIVPRGPELLASFGFAPVQFDYLATGWMASVGSTSRGATEDDLEDLAALYVATHARLPWSEERVLPDWRFWLASHLDVHVVEDARGRIIGYGVVDNGVVMEAAHVDAGAARTLLSALSHVHALYLPIQHPLVQAALHTGGVVQVAAKNIHAVPFGSRLAGVVDLPGILEQLKPMFEERLAHSRYVGWTGHLRIEIDTERVTLACKNGRVEVIDGSRSADLQLRRVTLPGLVQLCLGFRAVSDLRATHDLDCDDSALGLLERLFPVF